MKQKLVCCIFALIAIGMSVWAILGNMEITRLESRVAELEAQLDVAEPESLYAPDDAAAEFEGGVITVAEASAEYELLKPYYEMLGMVEEEYAEYAKLDLLDMLIEEKILEHKAREAGVFEPDDAARAELEARVRAEYEANLEYYMAFRFDESKTEGQVREETIAYLNENGYSYESLLAQAEAEAWQDRLFAHVTADLSVDDEQLRQFYRDQLASAEMVYSSNYTEYELDCESGRAVLWHPEGVRRVQMLVIPFDEAQSAEYTDIQALLAGGDASQLENLEALYNTLTSRAEEALARVDSGADFRVLMEEYGSGKPEGECISEKSTIFGDSIRDAAMSLKAIGDISGILRCDEGLCILRYASDVPAGAVPFEDVAEELRTNYAEELKLSLYNATVMGWLSEANAQYYPERF